MEQRKKSEVQHKDQKINVGERTPIFIKLTEILAIYIFKTAYPD